MINVLGSENQIYSFYNSCILSEQEPYVQNQTNTLVIHNLKRLVLIVATESMLLRLQFSLKVTKVFSSWFLAKSCIKPFTFQNNFSTGCSQWLCARVALQPNHGPPNFFLTLSLCIKELPKYFQVELSWKMIIIAFGISATGFTLFQKIIVI